MPSWDHTSVITYDINKESYLILMFKFIIIIILIEEKFYVICKWNSNRRKLIIK